MINTWWLKTKALVNRLGVLIWWHLPLRRPIKEKLKTVIYGSLPFLFRQSATYRNWKTFKQMASADYQVDLTKLPGSWPLDRINVELTRPRHYQKSQRQSIVTRTKQRIAVIIHVFYPDIFCELMDKLAAFRDQQCKLFIGTTAELYQTVSDRSKESGYGFFIGISENRGRDILPFLSLADQAINEGYEIILKLHTKRSDHRLSGDLWRKDIYRKLLSPAAVPRILSLFSEYPRLGVLGPAGHLVPLKFYYGSNARAIGYLAYRMRLPVEKLAEIQFVAGSMFYIRAEALKPLLALNLQVGLFEEETGQVDGTMAHAVERAFAISNYVSGHMLADSSSKPSRLGAAPTNDHPFTW